MLGRELLGAGSSWTRFVDVLNDHVLSAFGSLGIGWAVEIWKFPVPPT